MIAQAVLLQATINHPQETQTLRKVYGKWRIRTSATFLAANVDFQSTHHSRSTIDDTIGVKVPHIEEVLKDSLTTFLFTHLQSAPISLILLESSSQQRFAVSTAP